MSPLRMQHIRTLDELDGLKDTWQSLERREGGPSLFQSWSWNRLWCDEVLPHRPHGRLDIRVIEDGAGKPLAILPLYSEALVRPFASVTYFLGHRMSFHNDVLLAEPQNHALAREIAHLVLSEPSTRTILHLRDLNEASVFTQCLATHNSTEPQCPRVYLRADPALPDPLMRLGRSSRSSLRNHRNRLQRQCQVEFRRYSGSELPAAFDLLVDLHHKRFTSQQRPSSLSGPNVTFLRRASTEVGKVGTFVITLLHADDRAVAGELAAHDQQHYFSLIGGFDPDFASFSPAYLLFLEAIRHSFLDLGCNIFDFGPGYEKYKYDWSPMVGTNYMCCHGGSGLYGKALAAVYRSVFRTYLPSVPNTAGKKVAPASEQPFEKSSAPSVAT